MRAVVHTDQPTADRYRRAIDALLLYPRPGVDVGAGRHAPAAATVTVQHSYVRQHPARSEWAVPVDAEVDAQEGRTARVDGSDVVVSTATAEELDASWTLTRF